MPDGKMFFSCGSGSGQICELENGDLLIHLVNFRAASVTADVLYQAKLAGDEVYDCAAGKNLKASANGKYKSVKVTLPEMSSTVLRVKGR